MRTFWLSTIAVASRGGGQKIVAPLAETLATANWQGVLRSQGAPRNKDGTPTRAIKLFILDGPDPTSILSGVAGVVRVPEFAARETKADPSLARDAINAVVDHGVSLEKSEWANDGELVADIAKSLHPAWRTFDGRTASPSGTFTDNFDGAPSGSGRVELTAWTPSGGGAWTRIAGAGTTGEAIYAENNTCFERAGSSAGRVAYICTDQGSADHYTQAQVKAFGATSDDSGTVCVRLVDEDNWIGWRQRGTGASGFRLVEMVAGTQDDTLLQVQGVDEYYYRIEASGSSIELFESVDTASWASKGSVTNTSGQTETSQGLVSRFSQSAAWIDAFEAGALSGGPTLFEQAVAGSITPAGALATRMIFAETVAGTITAEGSILKLIRTSMVGQATPSGVMLRKTSTSMAGSTAPAGALSTLEVAQQAVAGSITPVGTLLKKISFGLASSMTPSGALTKKVRKTLQGSVTMTSALVKKAKITLAGVITATGITGIVWKQDVAGSTTPTGALATVLNVGGGIKRGFIMLFRRRRGGP